MTGNPALPPPSPWVLRFAHLIPAGGTVLDLACGRGRHARHFAAKGHKVTAVDRDGDALAALSAVPEIETLRADLEDGGRWPLEYRSFDAVIVANYFYEPLFGHIVDSVAMGGVLIYETFARGNEAFGKPANPDFLLRPGELLEAVRGKLRVVAYEDGIVGAPRPAAVQRIAAVRCDPDAAPVSL